MGSSGPGHLGCCSSLNRTLGFSILGEPLSESTVPSTVPPPHCFPFIGINLGTSSFHSSDFPHHSHLSALPFFPDTVAPPLRRLPRASKATWRKAGLGGRAGSICSPPVGWGTDG